MIISHRHRYVFVPIPKTGTHSVRRVLRETMGPDDLEQVGLFINKRFPYAELAETRHGHFSLSDVRPYVGTEVADGYFSFAFVRNPFDRFVSYCAFMTRQHGAFDADPRGTMHRILFQLRPTDHVHFKPQAALLCDAQGRVEVQRIGRTETMQADFDSICDTIGLPRQSLDVVNSSRRGHYRDYYDDELRRGVAEYYAADLDLFGYTF